MLKKTRQVYQYIVDQGEFAVGRKLDVPYKPMVFCIFSLMSFFIYGVILHNSVYLFVPLCSCWAIQTVGMYQRDFSEKKSKITQNIFSIKAVSKRDDHGVIHNMIVWLLIPSVGMV